MADLKQIHLINQDLAKRDKERDKKFLWMWQAHNNISAAPAGWSDKEWLMWFPTMKPSLAVAGATKVLSNLDPKFTYFPHAVGDENFAFSDKVERILKYNFLMAGKRGKSNPTRQMTLNALLFDMVAVQTSFLPYQAKNVEALGGNSEKLRKSRFGQYAIHNRSPRGVHAVHSDEGLHNVLHEQLFPTREIIGFWGGHAKKLKSEFAKNELPYCYVVDYWDEKERAVYCYLMEEGQTPNLELLAAKDAIVLVEPQAHGLPFIPWTIKGGGSTSDTLPEFHHRPVLDEIYQTGLKEKVDLMRSIVFSRQLAEYGKPSTKSTTHDGQTPEFDYDTPGGNVALRQGEDIQDMLPPQINSDMLLSYQTLEATMDDATLPAIVLGEVPGDISFATYNASQQSGVRSIIPFKEVSEEAHEEVASQMLLWAKFAKENMTGWGTTKQDKGKEYILKHGEIDDEHVQVDVTLAADVPTDRVSKINAAVMLVQNLGFSKASAMEEVGITDPVREQDKTAQELFDEVELQNAASELSNEFQQQLLEQAKQQVMQDPQFIQQVAQMLQQAQQQGGQNAQVPGPTG